MKQYLTGVNMKRLWKFGVTPASVRYESHGKANAKISGGTPSAGADCCATKGDGHEM